MNSTNKVLNKFSTALIRVCNNSQEITFLTDANHKIIAASDAFMQEFHVENLDVLVGNKITEVECLPFYVRHQAQIEKMQTEVVQNMAKLSLFQIMMEPLSLEIYIVNYYPVLDDVSSVLGVYVQLRRYELTHLIDVIFVVNNTKFQSNTQPDILSALTPKHKMVLFLVSRNYSYTEIAMWMSTFGFTMSPSCVNGYLMTLKEKLGVKNKTELKKIAYKSGITSQIPLGFLKDGVYDISSNRHELVICNNYPLSDTQLLSQFTAFQDRKLSNAYSQFSKSATAYLADFSENFCRLYNCLDNPSYIIDNEDNLIALSTAFIDEFAIESPTEYLNKPWHELLQHNTNLASYQLCAQTFKIQNQSIRKHKEKQIFLEIVQVGEQIKAYIVYKYPILDRNGCCYGVHIEMRKFVLPIIPYLIKAMKGFDVVPTFKWSTPQKLTERQHIVLFLYARNYSSSEIAQIMSENGAKISLGRVSEHLLNLKKKFSAGNEEQLRNVALLLGSYNYIPASWLKIGLFNITSRKIDRWVC